MGFSKKDIEFLKYYIDEKNRLLKEIDRFNSLISTGYKSQDFTEPKGTNSASDEHMIRIIMNNSRLRREIEKRLKKVEVIILKSYKIINKIEDLELKSIVELRAIKALTWEQIGEEVHMEKSWCYRRYKHFVEN